MKEEELRIEELAENLRDLDREKNIGEKSQAKLIIAIILTTLISSSLVIASNLANETSNFGAILENESVENLSQAIIPEPKLSVELKYPEKITRGEEFKIKAKIENIASSTVKILKVSWNLPENFEIISEKNDCEVLESGKYCFSEIIVFPSISTELGGKILKVVVSYE